MLVLLILLAGDGSEEPRRAPSFRHEVVPLFTRYGCSAGGCHGKQEGQKGFKLSLRGFAPEEDYENLVLASHGRRVEISAPAHSLFLLKATATLPHKGGEVIRRDSDAYRKLAEWVQAGAPGLVEGEPSLESIEIAGGGGRLKPGGEQGLSVQARFSDGASRDVTWLCQFFSNDASVLDVTREGRVRARRVGASAVRAHFQDKVAVAAFTVPHDRKLDPALFKVGSGDIDRHLLGRLEEMRVPPSPPAGDAEFLRRAFLDTIGALPLPAEAALFIDDPAPDKRARLVDALLARPEFTDFWALQLGDLLQNRRERDHDVRGVKGVRGFHQWLRKQVAANRPWNEMARDILLASGGTDQRPEIGYFVVTVGEQREADRSELVVSAAQSFLGTRIICAKCHNHPEERYTQDDYYRFAAFFSRISLDRQKSDKGSTTLAVMSPEEREQRKQLAGHEKDLDRLSAPEDEKTEGEARKTPGAIDQKRQQIADAHRRLAEIGRQSVRITQPRTKKLLEPRPLDRTEISLAPGKDPRRALVDWMTSPSNEYFSGNMVNRVWKHFMGAGLVDPVDDLRPSNPASNPALWAHLKESFVRGGFDLRKLMREILTSHAYQRGSATLPENVSDRQFCSHFQARRLPAEVLLDAISQATGVPENFAGSPVGTRAVQLPDPGVDSYFLALFGRSPRVTACACEREGDVTLPQLLHMMNGDTLAKKIGAPEGRLAALLRGSDVEAVEELFLATLSRRPREGERERVEKLIAASGGGRAGVLRDLFWALLNSKEFVFNH